MSFLSTTALVSLSVVSVAAGGHGHGGNGHGPHGGFFGQPKDVVGYIRPEYRFGAENYVNSGTATNNDANACLGFCMDIPGANLGMDLSLPLSLHACKSNMLAGGLDYAIDQRFVFNADGKHQVKFQVEEGWCTPGTNCPADWQLPLELCWEVEDEFIVLRECERWNQAQKFRLIQHGRNKGQLRHRHQCVQVVDRDVQTTNCNANFPCVPVDLSQCTATAEWPYTGSGGNLCHQALNVVVGDCPRHHHGDEDFEYWSDEQRTLWRVGEAIPTFPDFCDNLDA